MKYHVLAFAFIILIAAGCKAKKSTESADTNATIKEKSITPKTSGIISHQFRSTGCSTVIIIAPAEGQNDTLILIPRDLIPAVIDIDGTEISFNYHPLRMLQPEGCNKGIPAEITNIEKVKK